MSLGRFVCGNWDNATRHEWLVTNGLGGYACGTVAGANTRRYHGFLMASLKPPVERVLLVAKIDISVEYLGRTHALGSNEFEGGVIDPRGYRELESFEVLEGVPTWRYALQDALLQQQIFMQYGANTTYLRLAVLRASAPLSIRCKPLVTYRDYHAHARGMQPYQVEARHDGCSIQAFPGAMPYHLSISAGGYAPGIEWYWNFRHRAEAERGLDSVEDLCKPGLFTTELGCGESVNLAASTESHAIGGAAAALEITAARARTGAAALTRSAPLWVRNLAATSDQFIVQRHDSRDALSIIAGYPWFTDWGRDTMISLPGLTTTLGRFDAAAAILRTYARYVDGGMLPNRFPDRGESPEYNTADATLWYFQALQHYLDAKRDAELGRELFPTLMQIIEAHVAGTRYGIAVDPSDGLLRAGEPGMQLTWMDAKDGDTVFTPRIGKPVEINALWLNALEVALRLATRLRDARAKRLCQTWLDRGQAGFERFWNEDTAYLNDVIDVDGGSGVDTRLRPNQLLAVSLPYSALSPERMRAVVDVCARDLLTSYGLRSLGSSDPAYQAYYLGDSRQRDAAYHQGTVWSWLLGPFALAHYRVYGDAAKALEFLAPLEQHVGSACLGSVSEIFDGDAPHEPRGCFAQAWSVAEILRTWGTLGRKLATS